MPISVPENLIVRYLSNEATADEQEQLFDWIASDGAHQKIFNDWCEVWSKEHPTDVSFDIQAGLDALNTKIYLSEQKVKQAKPFTWLKAAAAILILATVSSLVYYTSKGVTKQNHAAVTLLTRINTAGQRSTIQLPDGSWVRLNAKSSLRFPETFNDTREVYLQGEAFFDVVRDTLKPFRVHHGTMVTQVLGTSFNIRQTEDQHQVTVVTGKVKVADAGSSVLLLPKEKLTCDVKNSQWKKTNVDLENELSWKEEILFINNKSLRDAGQLLEDWYGVKITFAGSAVTKCVVTGKYKNETLENVMAAIAYSTDITYQIKNKEVIISGKGCE